MVIKKLTSDKESCQYTLQQCVHKKNEAINAETSRQLVNTKDEIKVVYVFPYEQTKGGEDTEGTSQTEPNGKITLIITSSSK